MENTNENSQTDGGSQVPAAPVTTESLPIPAPPPDRIEKGNKDLPETIEKR